MSVAAHDEATEKSPRTSVPGGALLGRMSILTAIVVGLIVMIATHYAAVAFFVEPELPEGTDPPAALAYLLQNRIALATMFGWVIGFMIGIGAFNGPFRWLLGQDLTDEDLLFQAGKDQGVKRYFRFTTDHKVVGIQYLVITMILLGAGGTLAMLIRTDLMTPESKFLGPTTYNTVVGMHGIIMIIATIVMVTGPFGNHDRCPRHGVPPPERTQFLAAGLRGPGPAVCSLPRWNADRVVGVQPAGRPGAAGDERVRRDDHRVRRLQRGGRSEHHHDGREDADPRDDLDSHADLRVRCRGERGAGDPGVSGLHGFTGAVGTGSRRWSDLLRPLGWRQRVALREPLLAHGSP
jgi:hypothetical protein